MADAEKGRYPLPMMWALWGCVLRGFPSEAVATRDLDFRVSSLDEGQGMRLELTVVGPDGNVLVRGTDELSVLAAGEALPLQETEDGRYEAPLSEFEGDLEISMEREEDDDVSFLAPVVPLYELEAEASDERLLLTWEPAPGEHTLTLGLEGVCTQPVARQLAADTGSYSLSRAELPWVTTAPCALAVALEASYSSDSLLPGVEGGSYSVSSWRTSEVEVEWGP
jgi:hypothetical protein